MFSPTFNDSGFHQCWDVNELGIFFIVPHKQFPASRDVSKCPIINIPTILEHCHVLLFFVASTLDKPHPTRHVFFAAINKMTKLSVFVNLSWWKSKMQSMTVSIIETYSPSERNLSEHML